MKIPGVMQSLPIPTHMWIGIYMDFKLGLPISSNNLMIMVVVNRLSKYAHCCALLYSFTSSLVAQVFMDQIF